MWVVDFKEFYSMVKHQFQKLFKQMSTGFNFRSIILPYINDPANNINIKNINSNVKLFDDISLFLYVKVPMPAHRFRSSKWTILNVTDVLKLASNMYPVQIKTWWACIGNLTHSFSEIWNPFETANILNNDLQMGRTLENDF